MIEFYKTLSKLFGIDMFGITYTIYDHDEKTMWDNIVKKAERGYQEFCTECKLDSNYCGWPWVSPSLTKEESELLDKIHEYFYPSDNIVDPISVSQADYMWYEDVKNRIIMK